MNDFNTQRQHYRYFQTVSTRWMDNDIYGHVNNVTYYSYFDTVANQFLIDRGGLNIQDATVVGFVVASSCQYLAPIAYPQQLEVGFRVNRLGNSSVEYGIGIFSGKDLPIAAHGTFTHVFVERVTGEAAAIPEQIRAALQSVLVAEPDNK